MQVGYLYPLEEQGVLISFVAPSVANRQMITVSFAFEIFVEGSLMQLEEGEQRQRLAVPPVAVVVFGTAQKVSQTIFVAWACHVAAAAVGAQLHLRSRAQWPVTHSIHSRMPASPVHPWMMKSGDGSC